jgi:hypothetical protein
MITGEITGMSVLRLAAFKIFLLLLLCSFMDTRRDYLLGEQGEPQRPLYELLDLLNIPHEKDLSSVIKATQEKWCQLGKERWQFEERYENMKTQALPLLKTLGCIEEVHAAKKTYNYGIFPGGYIPRMKDRLNFMIQEWNRGVRFQEFVILTGERPLDPETEKNHIHLNTESEVLKVLLKEAPLPKEFREIPWTFINVPMQLNKENKPRRPNSQDTILEWLAQKPIPGSCVIFGNQPLVGYFDAVFRTYLPINFPVETIGGGADLSQSMAFFLDNLARTLYQENLCPQ